MEQQIERKKNPTSCSIFNLCFFANVLISNMLHKVECVFQPDELSLWSGGNRESGELRVGGIGRREEGGMMREGRVVGYLIWG